MFTLQHHAPKGKHHYTKAHSSYNSNLNLRIFSFALGRLCESSHSLTSHPASSVLFISLSFALFATLREILIKFAFSFLHILFRVLFIYKSVFIRVQHSFPLCFGAFARARIPLPAIFINLSSL